MKKLWTERAWEDFLYWHSQDKRYLRRVLKLLEDIDRHPYEGLGKPEPLKNEFSGFWSRRVDEKNRLVYSVEGDTVCILQCRTHYGDK